MIPLLRALMALVLIISIGGATAHGESAAECADESSGCCAKAKAPGHSADTHAVTAPDGASSLDPGDCAPLCASCSRPPTATVPAAPLPISILAPTLTGSVRLDDHAPPSPPSFGVFRPPRA